MSKKMESKVTLVARAEAFGKGMKKRFPNGAQVLDLGGGATVTVDAAGASLQEVVDNRSAAVGARASAKVKVAAENARIPVLRKFMAALEAFIRFTCGEDAAALADFGLEPHKAPRPLTAEEKAAAAAKREATREARGIIGTRKRKAVKGTVAATPAVAPAGGEPAAPAPAAGPVTPPKA